MLVRYISYIQQGKRYGRWVRAHVLVQYLRIRGFRGDALYKLMIDIDIDSTVHVSIGSQCRYSDLAQLTDRESTGLGVVWRQLLQWGSMNVIWSHFSYINQVFFSLVRFVMRYDIAIRLRLHGAYIDHHRLFPFYGDAASRLGAKKTPKFKHLPRSMMHLRTQQVHDLGGPLSLYKMLQPSQRKPLYQRTHSLLLPMCPPMG